jgi:hypothetical protein
VSALRHLRPFPPSHLALRAEMRRAGLGETLVAAGCDLASGVVVKSLQERRAERRKTRVRKPHKANLLLPAGALTGTAAGNAAQAAMIELAIEKYVSDKAAAASRRDTVSSLRRY